MRRRRSVSLKGHDRKSHTPVERLEDFRRRIPSITEEAYNGGLAPVFLNREESFSKGLFRGAKDNKIRRKS
ncbi:MAG: hypothetical protein QY310_02290 [Candidatus Jettenia sp. CY-1]|nr:MAG: hypothetical protein QY310_02290 [Candidatus Jettenia sp. CY-1]